MSNIVREFKHLAKDMVLPLARHAVLPAIAITVLVVSGCAATPPAKVLVNDHGSDGVYTHREVAIGSGVIDKVVKATEGVPILGEAVAGSALNRHVYVDQQGRTVVDDPNPNRKTQFCYSPDGNGTRANQNCTAPTIPPNAGLWVSYSDRVQYACPTGYSIKTLGQGKDTNGDLLTCMRNGASAVTFDNVASPIVRVNGKEYQLPCDSTQMMRGALKVQMLRNNPAQAGTCIDFKP